MAEKQKTIRQEFGLFGVGLHTGCHVNLRFKPAAPEAGIRFVRVDLPGRPTIQVDPSHIHIDTAIPRCTTIGLSGREAQAGRGQAVIHTVEHLMGVLCGLGLTNLTIEIDAIEIPGLDGSGRDFLRALKTAGIVEQEAEAPCFELKEPIGVELNDCSIYVMPARDFRISYVLDYHHPFLRSQFFSAVINAQTFEEGIAPSRTFCLEGEADELRRAGLGKGADYGNTLVVGDHGVIKNRVRFDNEFARHKVLDFIGDLYLLGLPIHGHVFAFKSGHTLNIQLLQKICQQKKQYPTGGRIAGDDLSRGRGIADSAKSLDINDIMRILPHRYPFLLVDRVVAMERGKRGVGIKNVTINDNFFQGHFPTRPVMPGVLMIEAMAQTAGVVMLTHEAHHGKVAFFLSVDNVKFRKVVVPGDQLVMEVEVVRDRAKTVKTHAVTKVAGEIVAEADMIFSFTDASYLD